MPTIGQGAGLGGLTIASSILYAFLGVLLLLAAYRLFDIIHPIDFNEELRKGNVAAGLTVAGLIIGVAIIIAAAIL